MCAKSAKRVTGESGALGGTRTRDLGLTGTRSIQLSYERVGLSASAFGVQAVLRALSGRPHLRSGWHRRPSTIHDIELLLSCHRIILGALGAAGIGPLLGICSTSLRLRDPSSCIWKQHQPHRRNDAGAAAT